MPTIALLASSQELLGFLLVAGSGGLSDLAPVADCLFTVVPSEPALRLHELGVFVQEHKNAEYQCRIQQTGSTFLLDVVLDPDVRVHLDAPTMGYGKWYVVSGMQRGIEAVCQLIPKRERRV